VSGKEVQPVVSEDRRGYFRIEDALSLSYHQVPPEEVQERLQRLEQGLESHFTVVSSLAAVTQEMAGVLHKIELESPEVADYLASLDRKLELMARALLSAGNELVETPAQPVNLSASGMAFNAAEAVPEGTLLELRLLLLPSFTGILTYGEVVGCEPRAPAEDEFPYCIRVNFSHMRESDRDVLIRHVIQRQTRMLRKLREERESERD
jgi:hypothetical protein